MKTNKTAHREFRAILFNPTGDHVTDFTGRESKQAVWDEINDMGSRWIFYPIPFIVTGDWIVDTPEGMEFLNRKNLHTVEKYFNETWEQNSEQICDDMNNGLPLSAIYNI